MMPRESLNGVNPGRIPGDGLQPFAPTFRDRGASQAFGTSVLIGRWPPALERQSRELRGTYAKTRFTMATERHGQIVETPTEARQAEPGPSVLALLAISTGLAVLILGIVWFAFFRV